MCLKYRGGKFTYLRLVQNWIKLLRNMARAGRRELVGINKETSVRITGIYGDHSMVNVFLSAFALVTGGKETASGVWGLTSLQAGGLSIIVMAITVFFGDVLEDDSPVTFNINGPADLSIINIRWAQVAFRSDPVSGVVWGGSFRSSSVVGVIK